LKEFPIKFLILRRDINCPSCPNLTESEIGKRFPLIYKNNTFTVYQIKDSPKIVNTKKAIFSVINPVKYRIQYANASEKVPLELLLSFNLDWKIFLQKKESRSCKDQVEYSSQIKECISDLKLFEGDEFSNLWKKPLFTHTHSLTRNYANIWQIDPNFIKKNYSKEFYTTNKDGSINFDIVILYQQQSWYHMTLLITIVSFGAAISYLLLTKIKKNKK
jgi:hypothetical protein